MDASGDMGMAEIDYEFALEVYKLQAAEFDKYTATEKSNYYRNVTNRGRIEAGVEILDHFEWRSKLQKVIRLLEGKTRVYNGT